MWNSSVHPPAAALLRRDPMAERAPRLRRLLVNVTVDGSLWPVHVDVLAADATVADLARAAVAAYVGEGRRPPLPADGDDDARFEVHFSKYSLDFLNPEEKVLDLGSRNFFLCPAAARLHHQEEIDPITMSELHVTN